MEAVGDRRSDVGEAPPLVHDVLQSPAQPLDGETRHLMQQRFHDDFGDVRVHTGPRAEESARRVDALAYTVGRDIVFAAGRYAPRTPAGKDILAHELAHVVQQGDGPVPSRLVIGASHGVHEAQAHGAARDAAAGRTVSGITAGVAPQVARRTDEDLAAKGEWNEKTPEERQKIMAAGPKLEYSDVKEKLYKGLIDGAIALRKGAVASLREHAATLPPDVKSVALSAIDVADGIMQVAFNFVFYVLGVIVGLGEGLVGLVTGLVSMLTALIKFLVHLLASIITNKSKYIAEDVRALKTFLDNFGPGIKKLFSDWTTKFSEAPQERQAAMVGELVGQVVAFIVTWEGMSAKLGKGPQLTMGAPVPAFAGNAGRAGAGAAALAGDATVAGGPLGAAGLVTAQASTLNQKGQSAQQQGNTGAGGGSKSPAPPSPKKPAPMRIEEPPVVVGPGDRGLAIEDQHLADLGGYTQLPPGFKAVDGVAGESHVVTEGGRQIQVYTRPDAVSVKSTEIVDAAKLEQKIRADLEPLRGAYSETKSGVRVEGLGQRELHLLFEEGRAGYIGKDTLAMLKRMQAEAGSIKFRWYVYVLGKKFPGPKYFKQFKQFLDLL